MHPRARKAHEVGRGAHVAHEGSDGALLCLGIGLWDRHEAAQDTARFNQHTHAASMSGHAHAISMIDQHERPQAV